MKRTMMVKITPMAWLRAVHRAIHPIQNIGAPDPGGPPKGSFWGPQKRREKGEKAKKKKEKKAEKGKKEDKREKKTKIKEKKVYANIRHQADLLEAFFYP